MAGEAQVYEPFLIQPLRRTRVGDHDSASCLSLDQALRRIADCTLEFPDDYRLPESSPTPGRQNE